MIKKLGLFSLLMFSAVIAKADIFDFSRDKLVTVHFSTSMGTALSATSYVLIDLSDTTNWPHKETGAISIHSIRLNVDKAAATTATLRIGVVTFVDASSGTVKWFYTAGNDLNVSNTEASQFSNYSEGFIRTKVQRANNAAGATPYLMSNETTTSSTLYQNDVTLVSPNGITTPGLGDIVMHVSKASTALNFNVELTYISERP